jgi:hypothetical protein
MIATFRSPEPVELRDGDQLIVERDGDRQTVRRIPRFDSDEPIRGFDAFVASVREFASRSRKR